MKLIDFVKKNYEIFVVNFIVLGFIAFTLLAQFGVHIKVDKGMDPVPVEIGYSQSTMRINSKFVDVSERYVRLEYENNAKKSFWMPASVVFGRVGEGRTIKKERFGKEDILCSFAECLFFLRT